MQLLTFRETKIASDKLMVGRYSWPHGKQAIWSSSAPNFTVAGDIIAHQGVCTPNCDEGTATVTTPIECEVSWSFM